MSERGSQLIAVAILLLGLGLLACGSTGPTGEPQDEIAAAEPVQAAATASSFIVQGSDFEEVRSLVEEVGGTVTHELRIIKAVGALLTPDQLEALGELGQDLKIHEDRQVEIGNATADETVRDEWTYASWSNNQGTVDWMANWQELGESNGTSSGRVRLYASSRCATGRCLRIGADEYSLNGYGVSRGADLAGVGSATLTYSYRRSGD